MPPTCADCGRPLTAENVGHLGPRSYCGPCLRALALELVAEVRPATATRQEPEPWALPFTRAPELN